MRRGAWRRPDDKANVAACRALRASQPADTTTLRRYGGQVKAMSPNRHATRLLQANRKEETVETVSHPTVSRGLGSACLSSKDLSERPQRVLVTRSAGRGEAAGDHQGVVDRRCLGLDEPALSHRAAILRDRSQSFFAMSAVGIRNPSFAGVFDSRWGISALGTEPVWLESSGQVCQTLGVARIARPPGFTHDL